MLNFKPRTTWTILNKKGEEKIRNDPEEKSKEERKSIPKKKNKEQKQQPRKSKIPLVEKQEVLYFDALSRIWTRGRVHKRISPTVYIVDFGGTHKKCHRDQLKPFIRKVTFAPTSHLPPQIDHPRTPPPATPPPNTDGDDPFVTPPQGSVTEPPKRKRRGAVLPTTPVIRRSERIRKKLIL
ncbi:transcription initiation factor TFIID subunit 3-like [Phlebotomus papatasi]|uniref:transcription initiation factor TFIID subunit 3-like n=1 Tax=Phlebotomus papatasi TaxID=29031 RepID=UPI00248353F3|nr:transcription initiation factor TFIID subunit 3-like [Phlebotomus papatasi]